jgi:hypothetical protein
MYPLGHKVSETNSTGITRGDDACWDENARVNPTLKVARLATDDNNILRRLYELFPSLLTTFVWIDDCPH